MAVTEMFFDSDWAYEREYLNGRTAYSQEAEQTMPSVVIVSRQIGVREFDPGRTIPMVNRFGVIRRKPVAPGFGSWPKPPHAAFLRLNLPATSPSRHMPHVRIHPLRAAPAAGRNLSWQKTI
jgi:hypothetical protein